MTPTGAPTPRTLQALTHTAVFQRLRGVSQAGAPALLKATRSATRYQHSIGVLRLAQRLHLPAANQAAALLHDVTHSAFSHTIDYLTDNPCEDTHDRHAHQLLTSPELTALLSPDQLQGIVAAIGDKPHWLRTLDAVDYTLRDLRHADLLDRATAQQVIGALAYRYGHVCFTSPTAAWTFIKLMAQAGTVLYTDAVDLYLHRRLAQLLKTAIETGCMTFNELMTTDDTAVIRTLAAQPKLRTPLRTLLEVRPGNLRQRRDGRNMTSKIRLLDPLVNVTAHELVPLSEVTPRWHAERQTAERRAEIGVPLLTTR